MDKLFLRVRQIAHTIAGSETKLAVALGLTQRKFNGYLNEKSEKNLWQYLPKILEIYPEVSRGWLYFGEENPIAKKDSQAPKAIPLIGFADCGVQGWHGAMTIPVTVSAPTWHDKMIACMASGDSMLPAGIGNGHICYCDPTLEPVMGEPVYIEQTNTMSTLKIFCGRTERGGKEYIELQGWQDIKHAKLVQKKFSISILSTAIALIAPVVYVRRRL